MQGKSVSATLTLLPECALPPYGLFNAASPCYLGSFCHRNVEMQPWQLRTPSLHLL